MPWSRKRAGSGARRGLPSSPRGSCFRPYSGTRLSGCVHAVTVTRVSLRPDARIPSAGRARLSCPRGVSLMGEGRARHAAVRAPHAEAPTRSIQATPASRCGARPSYGRRAPVMHDGHAPQHDARPPHAAAHVRAMGRTCPSCMTDARLTLWRASLTLRCTRSSARREVPLWREARACQAAARAQPETDAHALVAASARGRALAPRPFTAAARSPRPPARRRARDCAG